MKFIIERASCILHGIEKPCDSAIQEIFAKVEAENNSSPQSAYGGEEKWFAKGTNHRIINNCIVRDIGEIKKWTIEITSLQDLLKFIKEHGGEDGIIIQLKEKYDELYTITIYDYYVE